MQKPVRPLSIFLLFAAAVCSVGFYFGAYAYFKDAELEKAQARLSLYRTTVETEMRHFAHLPFLLSLDPVVLATLDGADRVELDKRLARFAQSAGIDAIYLMDATGETISASNARSESSFVGQNYGFRPYFQAARRGELGEFYGIGATTGIPGYFYALAVGQTGGVIAIKLDLSGLQNAWQASGERIVLSNGDGVVLLASDPEWRYRTLSPLTDDQKNRILKARQFGTEPLDALDWTSDSDAQTAIVGEERFLYLRTGNLPNRWALHFFVPDDVAVTRASLATGTLALLSGLAFLIWQLRRVRVIGAALAKSEREEAALRQSNERLAIEIEERRTAERDLQKTQAELERAGRLAALGQLASSVTHELGQPIAAMRNQLAASEIASGSSPLNDKMQGLVARMEDITRQLKFFSRKGRDKFEPVDLRDVVSSTMELLSTTINEVDARVTPQTGTEPVIVQGNRLRLEQVLVNLVRNALDAVEGRQERQIDISFGAEEREAWLEVADTGHGLEGQTLDDLREPFATTRESGKGMGLGLTISAGIVTDHGGVLTATGREHGGAVFRASFPKADNP